MEQRRPQESDQGRSTFGTSLQEGTALAALTGAAYIIAFAYESEYLNTFGVPISFVRVELQDVLIAFAGMSGVLYMLVQIANLVAMVWPEAPELQTKALRVSWFLLFPATHVLLFGFRRQDWALYAIALAWLVVVEGLWPFAMRSGRTWKEKVIADEHLEGQARSRTLYGRLANRIGRSGYLLLLALLGCVLVARQAGSAAAVNQRTFHVLKSEPDWVVVRMYRDITLLVPADRSTGHVRRELAIRQTQGLEFEEELLGPLAVESPIPRASASPLVVASPKAVPLSGVTTSAAASPSFQNSPAE